MITLLLAGLMWAAQDEPAVTVESLLPKLVENGMRYEKALPSVSCEEVIRSQIVHKGKVQREFLVTAVLTVRRTEDEDGPFEEGHHWKTVNGEDIPEGKRPRLPYFVSGLFTNALGFNSVAGAQCTEMTLTQSAGSPLLLLSTRRKDGADSIPECETKFPGLRRTVYVDRKTEHVVRMVRTIPAAEAVPSHEVQFASVEYKPVKLGEQTFWLPLRAESRDEKDEGRVLVEYSGCHRYASTVTITGGTQTVADPH